MPVISLSIGGMLSKRLRAARFKAHLSQRQLGERAGVAASVIADIERGKTAIPAFDKLVKIARALGMDPEQLCPVVPSRKAS